MVSMCIISNKIKSKKIFPNTKIMRWGEIIENDITAYSIIVFDQEMKEYDYDVASMSKAQTEQIMKNGGVLICLPSTIDRNLFSIIKSCWIYDEEGKSTIVNENSFKRCETSYDWFFDENYIGSLGLFEHQNKKVEKQLVTIIANGKIREYLESVEVYFTLEGFEWSSNRKASLKLRRYPQLIPDSINSKVFALLRENQKPTAVMIDIKLGKLVILPKSNKKSDELILELFDIGKEIYENTKRESMLSTRKPEWIKAYVTEKQRLIEEEIEKKYLEISNHRDKLEKLKNTNILLYGSGGNLEDAVENVFEYFNLNVIRDRKKRPYDFIILNFLGIHKIFVEVTAEKKLTKKSRKMGQILDIYNYEEFDSEKDIYVLVCNFQKDVDPSERLYDELISKEVKMILENNKIPVIHTAELHEHWSKLTDKKITIKEIHEFLSKRIMMYYKSHNLY